MAYATINFVHPVSGRIREAPIGFSWTTLLFGPFPALFRGHWLWAFIMLALACVTFGLAWLVLPFLYNKIYARHLIGEGFKATGSTMDLSVLEQKIGQKIPQQ